MLIKLIPFLFLVSCTAPKPTPAGPVFIPYPENCSIATIPSPQPQEPIILPVLETPPPIPDSTEYQYYPKVKSDSSKPVIPKTYTLAKEAPEGYVPPQIDIMDWLKADNARRDGQH